MSLKWMSANEIYLKAFNEKRTLHLLVEEEFVPGKLNYSIINYSIDKCGDPSIIKTWHYSYYQDLLIPFNRTIHKGIELQAIADIDNLVWHSCLDKPVKDSQIIVSSSYNKNKMPLAGYKKWHLGTYKKFLFFDDYISTTFDEDFYKVESFDVFFSITYTQKPKADKIPFSVCLKWTYLDDVLKLFKSKPKKTILV